MSGSGDRPVLPVRRADVPELTRRRLSKLGPSGDPSPADRPGHVHGPEPDEPVDLADHRPAVAEALDRLREADRGKVPPRRHDARSPLLLTAAGLVAVSVLVVGGFSGLRRLDDRSDQQASTATSRSVVNSPTKSVTAPGADTLVGSTWRPLPLAEPPRPSPPAAVVGAIRASAVVLTVADGAVVGTSPLVLDGVLNAPAGSQLLVAGNRVPVGQDGRWSTSVLLVPGSNSIELTIVPADASAGVLATGTLHVTLDASAAAPADVVTKTS